MLNTLQWQPVDERRTRCKEVSLNKGPGRVGLFVNVFNVCVPVDGFVDGYS
jgi:hypothetical protein